MEIREYKTSWAHMFDVAGDPGHYSLSLSPTSTLAHITYYATPDTYFDQAERVATIDRQKTEDFDREVKVQIEKHAQERKGNTP